MAILMYDDIREAADPAAMVLDFCESTFQASAKLAKWDLEALTSPWAPRAAAT